MIAASYTADAQWCSRVCLHQRFDGRLTECAGWLLLDAQPFAVGETACLRMMGLQTQEADCVRAGLLASSDASNER